MFVSILLNCHPVWQADSRVEVLIVEEGGAEDRAEEVEVGDTEEAHRGAEVEDLLEIASASLTHSSCSVLIL